MTVPEKEQFFLTILEENKEQIYRICWGFCKETTEAEDLYQEVLLRIWKGVEGYKGTAKVSTWVYRITINTCLYWQNKNKKAKIWQPIKDLDKDTSTKNAEEQIIYEEQMEQLKKAIQLLNDSDRTIALLLLESVSYKEIAEITGLTVNNVGVKITRVKQRIKKYMDSF